MKIFYIFGKSGTGKDTLKNNLLKVTDVELTPLIVVTDRPIRVGEKEGENYIFKTPEEFSELINNDELMEYREYTVYDGNGEKAIWRYGTFKVDPKAGDNTLYIGIGSIESYKFIKNLYGDSVVPIYIMVNDDERLHRLIIRDGNNKNKLKEICRRFIAECDEYSSDELNALHLSRHAVFNNKSMPDMISKVIAYILKEKRK